MPSAGAPSPEHPHPAGLPGCPDFGRTAFPGSLSVVCSHVPARSAPPGTPQRLSSASDRHHPARHAALPPVPPGSALSPDGREPGVPASHRPGTVFLPAALPPEAPPASPESGRTRPDTTDLTAGTPARLPEIFPGVFPVTFSMSAPLHSISLTPEKPPGAVPSAPAVPGILPGQRAPLPPSAPDFEVFLPVYGTFPTDSAFFSGFGSEPSADVPKFHMPAVFSPAPHRAEAHPASAGSDPPAPVSGSHRLRQLPGTWPPSPVQMLPNGSFLPVPVFPFSQAPDGSVRRQASGLHSLPVSPSLPRSSGFPPTTDAEMQAVPLHLSGTALSKTAIFLPTPELPPPPSWEPSPAG